MKNKNFGFFLPFLKPSVYNVNFKKQPVLFFVLFVDTIHFLLLLLLEDDEKIYPIPAPKTGLKRQIEGPTSSYCCLVWHTV